VSSSFELRCDLAPATLDGIAPAGQGARPVVVIRPPGGWQIINVRELWRARELVYFLACRDVKVRYKQTVLGIAWAVLQPVLMMAVFTIVFGRTGGAGPADRPYALYAYAGLVPWMFFATAITAAGNSVVGSERLITKIYFPRLSIPLAAIGAAAVDFVVALGLLVGLMIFYRIGFGFGLLLMPVVFGLIAMAAVGIGTALAALNVAYRDVRYVIPFLVQLWMFATPAIYLDPGFTAPATSAATGDHLPGVGEVRRPSAPVRTREIPATAERTGAASHLDTLLTLNPMNALIAGFRATILGGPFHWRQLAAASVSVVLAFVVGCLYFRTVEDGFADII
jgi:lipopolysaccharide transport system permease protein